MLVSANVVALRSSGVVLKAQTTRDNLAQGLRYLITAGSVALFYLGLMALGLLLGLHYFLAIVIAQVVTISVAFPLYRAFVFRSKGTLGADFVRFLTVWVSGAVAGLLVTPALVELVHLHPLVAQVIAVAAVSVASFLAHRFFSFRSRIPSEADSPESPS